MLLLMALTTSCDVVDDIYPDFDAAQRDNALRRGWLPSWLPKSATDIKSRQDIDRNDYSFAFAMPANEALDLPENCTAVVNPPAPTTRLPNFPKDIESYQNIMQCPELNQNGPRYVVKYGTIIFGWSTD
jgi:hypothetical protein